MRIRCLSLAVMAGMLVSTAGMAQELPHQQQARTIFAKLVGFRSAAGQGQGQAIAQYVSETLQAGGVPAADIAMLPNNDSPAVLVRLPGRDAAVRPLLFSGHMDVVDALPADWARDPFTLVEEKGYFFGRGTGDNKTGIAALMSTILRMKADGQMPRRTLIFAFIGDEETGMATTRLAATHDWVRNAEFAINTDAGGGTVSEDGKPMIYAVQGAEKTYATFKLTARNPGGHSSIPRADNAIYDLAEALVRIKGHQFPAQWNPLTLSYFKAMSQVTPGAEGKALARFAANPQDAEALALVRASEGGTLGTTCVATMLDAGHAENALPQRAEALVNCRIFPGTKVEAVSATLAQVVKNPAIAIETTGSPAESPVSEPRDDVMGAIARSIHKRYPGMPITPYLESGGTDGLVYRAAGIPTFASSGIFMKGSDIFFHGLNERIPVASFYEAVDHIHDLAVDLGGR
ncbi:MAG: M20/M25/M40 family metallo-hydrolase [Pseudomonadota bacterium]|nr:M20/M25/M40 family metallo-hydrolase [Pseudomonadota bacterium]